MNDDGVDLRIQDPSEEVVDGGVGGLDIMVVVAENRQLHLVHAVPHDPELDRHGVFRVCQAAAWAVSWGILRIGLGTYQIDFMRSSS